MSDDFDFDPNDLFDDFDDDDEFGGDDFSAEFGDDDFDDFGAGDFEDDDFGANLDLDFIDDGEEDEFAAVEQQGGGNRAFLFAALAMVAVFILGLLLILFLIFQGNEQDRQELIARNATATSIVLTNAQVETEIALSATAAVENATATAVAIDQLTADALQDATEQANATATASAEAALDATAMAIEMLTEKAEEELELSIEQTATAEQEIALGATETAIAVELTLNPPIVVTDALDGTDDPAAGATVDLPSVEQTATALALIFQSTSTPSDVQPTLSVDATDIVVSTPDGTTTGTTTGTLPDTGLFDDVFQGNPLTIFLAAFGLLGVIIVSRTARGKRKNDE